MPSHILNMPNTFLTQTKCMCIFIRFCVSKAEDDTKLQKATVIFLFRSAIAVRSICRWSFSEKKKMKHRSISFMNSSIMQTCLLFFVPSTTSYFFTFFLSSHFCFLKSVPRTARDQVNSAWLLYKFWNSINNLISFHDLSFATSL